MARLASLGPYGSAILKVRDLDGTAMQVYVSCVIRLTSLLPHNAMLEVWNQDGMTF